jgi:hypothetical protein
MTSADVILQMSSGIETYGSFTKPMLRKGLAQDDNVF